jgi:hypothetical protein
MPIGLSNNNEHVSNADEIENGNLCNWYFPGAIYERKTICNNNKKCTKRYRENPLKINHKHFNVIANRPEL